MEDFAPTALFAYGTLALPDVVDALTGRVPAARPARLAGYRCRLIRGQDDAGIERHPGSATDGILYQDLTTAELSLLDAFETTPYRRRVVKVQPASGPSVRAWAYVVPSHATNLLSPSPWEPQRFPQTARGDTLKTCRELRASGPPLMKL